MSFWSNAKEKVLQAVKPRQQESQGHASQRADGSTSGYVPGLKPNGKQTDNNGAQRGMSWTGMVPNGVDLGSMPQPQPVGGQTGQMPTQQGGVPQPGMPQQPPYAQTGYQQPTGRPQAQFKGNAQAPQQPQQPTPPPFSQRPYQQPVPPQQPQGGYNVPPQQPLQQQPVPQPQPAPQAYPFANGDSYVVDGNTYKMIMRVAQVTGVPSCFRVIEFMYNNEAVIVNAEQVTDLVEADRCMDLIFGAACAMQQRLMRVSGKQIYLITPPQIYVAPFEQLQRFGMEDIERRWPGALQANMQSPQMVNNVQQMPMMGAAQPMGAGHPMQQMYSQPRQDDFAGNAGRRAARMNTNGYTDYNGFGNRSR